MKLGLGLYRHQLDDEHYRFARQCGCTHLVIHLVDYHRSDRPGDQPVGDDHGWGLAEMTEGGLYDAVETYSRQGKLAYVHLRNVRGQVPRYRETFIDDGDVDVPRV